MSLASKISFYPEPILRLALKQETARGRSIGERAVEEAKSLCPVDTGNLRDSIDFAEESQGRAILIRIFTNTGYGAFVELGTSKAAAQPFLAPGAQTAIKEYLKGRL